MPYTEPSPGVGEPIKGFFAIHTGHAGLALDNLALLALAAELSCNGCRAVSSFEIDDDLPRYSHCMRGEVA